MPLVVAVVVVLAVWAENSVRDTKRDQIYWKMPFGSKINFYEAEEQNLVNGPK